MTVNPARASIYGAGTLGIAAFVFKMLAVEYPDGDVERGELATLVGQAAAELAAIGDFWGGGKAGTAFARGEGGGAGYEAVSAQVVEGLGALLEAHGSISTRLRLMARRVEVADWDTVAALLALPEPPP
ncbi:hypothetical protein [Nocardia aurea]|uniref:hypothetical protein n=1 Tax=Nocardia aurea TaxID=2144174 RepID=UPI000D6987BD|nr:hypothetical protein [Nocardia aurea]